MPHPSSTTFIKLQLAQAIKDYIIHTKLSQTDAAMLLHTTQPRMSYLMRKHVDIFTIDTMIKMLATINYKVIIQCHPKHKKPKTRA